MKSSILLAVLVATTTFSGAFAQESRSSKAVTAGSSAASAMVAGYVSAKAFVQVSAIEKRFSRDIFVVDARFVDPESVATKVKSGDTVTIQYTKTDRISQIEARLAKTYEELVDLEERFEAEKAQAIKNSKPQFNYLHHEAANMEVANEHAAKAMKLKKLAELKVAEHHRQAAYLKEVRSPVNIVLKNTNPTAVGARLAELKDLRYSVYVVKRVPGSIVKKLGTVSRNGWLLAGTAVAMGFVTAEEIYSGKVATKLDSELKDLRN